MQIQMLGSLNAQLKSILKMNFTIAYPQFLITVFSKIVYNLKMLQACQMLSVSEYKNSLLFTSACHFTYVMYSGLVCFIAQVSTISK